MLCPSVARASSGLEIVVSVALLFGVDLVFAHAMSAIRLGIMGHGCTFPIPRRGPGRPSARIPGLRIRARDPTACLRVSGAGPARMWGRLSLGGRDLDPGPEGLRIRRDRESRRRYDLSRLGVLLVRAAEGQRHKETEAFPHDVEGPIRNI